MQTYFFEEETMTNFNRILCAVDFSPTSLRAFETAVDLAARLGSEVHVMHVYQLPAYAMPDGGAFEIPPEVQVGLTQQMEAHLKSFIKPKEGVNVTITPALYEGVPYVEIVRAAKEQGADLVVIGTHGHTGLSHLLMGSVAERVVRTSEVPVLTVRTP
jgi:nucleotide-binding universal stress UspA family protein